MYNCSFPYKNYVLLLTKNINYANVYNINYKFISRNLLLLTRRILRKTDDRKFVCD